MSDRLKYAGLIAGACVLLALMWAALSDFGGAPNVWESDRALFKALHDSEAVPAELDYSAWCAVPYETRKGIIDSYLKKEPAHAAPAEE